METPLKVLKEWKNIINFTIKYHGYHRPISSYMMTRHHIDESSNKKNKIALYVKEFYEKHKILSGLHMSQTHQTVFIEVQSFVMACFSSY